MRPAEPNPELQLEDPKPQLQDLEPQEQEVELRNTMSEQGSDQVDNHSVTKKPARSSLCFQFKDNEPPNIEVKEVKKLKLPPASNKGMWKGIDEDLVMICWDIVGGSNDERLQKTEEKVYAYLESRFGEEVKVYDKRPVKEEGETKAIRCAKRDSRKEVKRAKKSKDKTSIEEAKKEYLRLVRLHNKSRRNELRKKRKKADRKEQEKFRKNPYDYSKKLLDEQVKGSPTFSKEDADQFFKKEYSDKERAVLYKKLEGLPEVQDPKVSFSMTKLCRAEFDKKLKSRRNKSSPGPNGVPYVVYKRCPRITHIVYLLMANLWQERTVPLQWRFGEAILIPKTEDLGDPSKFRNITKTNTSGKLSMGVLADKMLDYMVSNGYIDTSVQKGFMKKMSGCLEHTQVLMEELKDAKSTRRQMFVVWVDLMNAYGRVPHNLILFALKHYKFPKWLLEYIYKYYDELTVRIVTKDWKSNWFYYLIGLFQGDPLSVVLFLIVFNLLLDLLKSRQGLGYRPSFSSSQTSNRAFADDLTLMSSRLEKLKEQIEVMERFLNWTRKMKAKPSKCIALGMKVIDGTYQAFDPEIVIDGKAVDYVGNTPMKFLGHWIYVDLGLKHTKQLIEDKLMSLFQKVDECGLNGVMKCWVYNNMLTSKMSWELMIYNLPVSFVRELDAICTRFLKKWLGVTKSITVSVLYRKKDFFGMGLKRLMDLYTVLQVSKAHTMQRSDDPKVREAYQHRLTKEEKSERWSGTKELTARERDLYFQELVGVVTKDRKGLGNSKQLSERDKLKIAVASISENDMLLTLVDKGVQGKFLTWENTMQLDLGWSNLIYNYRFSPSLLKFHLNAIHDVAHTPANLKLWNYSNTGKCPLCGWNTCNIKHILAVCSVARNTKRYNWRHDNVLRVIAGALMMQIGQFNRGEHVQRLHKEWTKFKSKKTQYGRPEKKMEMRKSFPGEAKDWKILWDEDKYPAHFPQHIYNTAERPDIVVWSDSSKQVILIELTCGDESNFGDQVERKENRYNRELIPGINNGDWTAKLFTVEIGCRGLWHHTAPALFNYFGLDKRTKKTVLQEAALTSLKCSYAIWLARNNKTWSVNYDIVQRPQGINSES